MLDERCDTKPAAPPAGAGAGPGPAPMTPDRSPALPCWLVTPKPPRPKPADYSATGTWPDGPLKPDAPPAARLAQGVAQRLQDRLKNMTVYRAAQRSDLNAQTIHTLLEGRNWPDLHTLACLEASLNTCLWGREHQT